MADNIEKIEKLKSLAESIQAAKLGKRGKDIHINSYVVIDEYHEWRTETEDLLGQYFDESNPHYQKFINVDRGGNGHVLMSYFNLQFPIFKMLIKIIESGEAMKLSKKIAVLKDEEKVEGKLIFISHASKDKEIIDAFVDIILHGALSVPINKIFCVSTDGTKIKSGADWRDSINESLLSAKLNFLIITPNYKESEVCLNEMGAAWVTSAIVLPLIVDPINYKTVGVLQEPNQIEKLLDEKSLDRIKDIVQEKLEIPPSLIKSDRWTAKKTEFLLRVKKYISSNPFDVPMDRNTFNDIIKGKEALEATVNNLIEEKATLEDLISELKKAKDKKDVVEIVKNQKSSTQFQEFIELCTVVKKLLSKNNKLINGIIFKSYSGKEITIKSEGNEDVLDKALANDYIDETLCVNWEATSEMSDVFDALNKVSKFLESNLKSDFYESCKEKYNAPIDIRNMKFWEKVFEVSLSFS